MIASGPSTEQNQTSLPPSTSVSAASALWSIKRLLAFGSGVGIEIAGPRGAESLRIAAVRVRPNGARLLGGFTIEGFSFQPATEWGAVYAAFLKKLGLGHVAAAVLLPREDVILRQISVPGVADKDLAAAVGYQMDGLHPYADEDVVSSWARLPGTSTVLVAIARRDTINRYAALFAEANVKIASFICAPEAIFSSLRLFAPQAPTEVLAIEENDSQIQVYGESPARPLFSATFSSIGSERAVALACAELRLDPLTQPRSFHALLGSAPALPYAAALASACPRLFLPVNLLPVEKRQSSSRLLMIPSIVLATLVLAGVIALLVYPHFQNRGYLQSLNEEIAKIQPQASRAAKLDHDTETARQRTALLDQVRKRSKLDIDVIGEMTRILPPPIWLNTLEITRTNVVVSGEADQAAPLLKIIDASPLFENSEFQAPPVRAGNVEAFRIRMNREAGK